MTPVAYRLRGSAFCPALFEKATALTVAVVFLRRGVGMPAFPFVFVSAGRARNGILLPRRLSGGASRRRPQASLCTYTVTLIVNFRSAVTE